MCVNSVVGGLIEVIAEVRAKYVAKKGGVWIPVSMQLIV
jgi:hypothetical protein